MKNPVNIFWFRRDLRLHDNHGLFMAFTDNLPVLPLFIFDSDILDKLENKSDARVTFIHDSLQSMHEKLLGQGSGMLVMHGRPEEVWQQVMSTYDIRAVYCNHDYEPYAIRRDQSVANLLKKKNIAFHTFKDQVIFEKREVCKDDGLPYTVFTPYSRRWKSQLTETSFSSFPSENKQASFVKSDFPAQLPALTSIGFNQTTLSFPPSAADDELIRHYAERRDIPGIHGTSRLGVHLRFGTISIRQLARKAQELSETFLNELIWRDFYHMILWNFPQVGEGKSFKPAYDRIQWRHDEEGLDRWCRGMTGYPIVDAGMRELNATGFMHNRVRMITASFLCKHLLIDWRLGEAYFAEKLLDFDLAANNGGWQWAAGSGCDAAPYFRVFNPYLQTKKFDPAFRYIRQWVPEFEEFSYPKPLVDHEFARKRCLDVYSSALKER